MDEVASVVLPLDFRGLPEEVKHSDTVGGENGGRATESGGAVGRVVIIVMPATHLLLTYFTQAIYSLQLR